MKRKTFNLISSISAFALGTIYLFSDSASITANVIGSSGDSTGFTSIMGIIMIIGSMVLFEVSLSSSDTKDIALERLVRGTKNHEEIYDRSSGAEPKVELHHSQHEKKK